MLPDLEFISGASGRALSVVLCLFASLQCLDLAETGKSYIVHLCDKIEVTEDMALGQWRTRRNSASTLPGLFYFWRDGLILTQDLNDPFYLFVFCIIWKCYKHKLYSHQLFILKTFKLREKLNKQYKNTQHNLHVGSPIIRLPWFLLGRFRMNIFGKKSTNVVICT